MKASNTRQLGFKDLMTIVFQCKWSRDLLSLKILGSNIGLTMLEVFIAKGVWFSRDKMDNQIKVMAHNQIRV